MARQGTLSLDDRWNGPEGLKEPGNYFLYSTGNLFMGSIFYVEKLNKRPVTQNAIERIFQHKCTRPEESLKILSK